MEGIKLSTPPRYDILLLHMSDSPSIKLYKKLQEPKSVKSKYRLKTRKDLNIAYTPGVADVSMAVFKDPSKAHTYTYKANSVAVVSDGSAVLGLGNIGPEAALPVMEGKALIFREFAGIEAVPIVLNTHDPDEIIAAVRAIAPTFGGINLEDIKAPECFYIEEELKKVLDIPVIHDDQWGTAVTTLAALTNALKVVGKKITNIKIVILGAGAAGTAVSKIFTKKGAKNIILVDRKGIIYKKRLGNSPEKEALASFTNPKKIKGTIEDAFVGADIFISFATRGAVVTPAMIQSMNKRSILFTLTNPVPEIMPKEAYRAGAYLVATGRSGDPNQINNLLAFPGLFRGALDNKVKKVTIEMLIRAAENLAGVIPNPTRELFIPSPLDKRVVKAVAKAIK